MTKKRAILLSLRNSDFTEMLRLAVALKGDGRYEPLIMTHTGVEADIRNQKERCAQAGVQLMITREAALKGPNKPSAPRKLLMQSGILYEILAWPISVISPFLKPLSFLRYMGMFRAQMKLFQDTINRYKPDILIVAEDIVGMTLPLFIKIGHDNGIPTAIVPYTIANAVEAAESLHVYPNYRVSGPFIKTIAALFPNWVYTYKGHRLLRLPFYYILAHAFFKLTPPDPWTMNSGFANAIAIENAHMKTYYLNEGFFEEKLRVTGAIYDDTLSAALRDKETRREKLYATLGLPSGKRLIVVGAPPNQLATPRPACPYTSYEKALDDLAILLAGLKDWNVVIRPHPNFRNIAAIFEKHGLRVTEIDTAELIPLADIYIAYASATIRWAIACGIPAVNYDLFQYHYDDYKTAPGVIHAYQPDEFNAVVTRLASESDFYADIKARQESAMGLWGHTDGQSTTRMIALFEELTAQKPVPRTPTTKTRVS